MISKIKKIKTISLIVISIFLFLFICAGIDDFIKTKDPIDILVIALFVLPFYLSVKSLFKDPLKKVRERASYRITASKTDVNHKSEDLTSKIELVVDPYFEKAGQIVIDKGKASVGMLQRTLMIGFNRADRIMNQLGHAGVVGPENGISPRAILMTSEEFRLFLNSCDIVYESCNEFVYKENNDSKMSDATGRISMYNNKFDYMNGHDFEYFCADILKKNGYENVEVTQGSGDHGIDILAEKDDITYAIQCKCYSKDIGNAAVQQAHTGKSIYKKDIAAVMTNRYFTPQAKEEADLLGVKLWDRDKLMSLLEKSHKI